jgi:hypothetical protein
MLYEFTKVYHKNSCDMKVQVVTLLVYIGSLVPLVLSNRFLSGCILNSLPPTEALWLLSIGSPRASLRVLRGASRSPALQGNSESTSKHGPLCCLLDKTFLNSCIF